MTMPVANSSASTGAWFGKLARLVPPAAVVSTAAIAAYTIAPFMVPLLQGQASPKFEVSAAPVYAHPTVPAHVSPQREAIPRRAPLAEPSLSPSPADVVMPTIAGVVAGVAGGLLAPRSGVGLPHPAPPVMRERPFVDHARPWRDSPMRGFEARGGGERLAPQEFLRHGGGFARQMPFHGPFGGQRLLPFGGSRFGGFPRMGGMFRGFHHF